MTTRRIAAIIPFYQTESGILRRAMLSILDQNLPADTSVHVFIIDDSSPMPPDADLAELPLRDDIRFSVHHQPNAGPGGARNRGLELTERETFDFVAFLDSDDVWHAPHLSDALAALDQGYGFYFCDNTREGAHESYSESVPALGNQGERLREKAEILSADGPVLGFSGGALAQEMIADYLCQTSCIVMSVDAVKNRRFDLEQRVAGEDYLFWVGVALDRQGIAISWRRHVSCGRGVNVFFSAFNWDDSKTLERLGHLLLLAEKLKHWPQAMSLCGAHVEATLKKYRFAYSYIFFRTILKGRRPSRESLTKIRRLDPWLPLRMPFLFARVALDRRLERKW